MEHTYKEFLNNYVTMKIVRIFYMSCMLMFITLHSYAQHNTNETPFNKRVYYTNACELLFQYVPTTSPTEEYVFGVKTNYFFNLVYNMHIDFAKSFGVIPGISLRNVGIKTFDETIQNVEYKKIKRRSYLLGVSAAVKVGNMQKYSFLYVGGAYEYSFHYKQKNFTPSKKSIQKEWHSNATELFLPSVFIGYQFPRYMNIQLRYYLANFLNPLYDGKYGNFTHFPDSRILQFSISLQQNQFEQSKQVRKHIAPPHTIDI